ncbi:uncharacterized protein F5147DRAFT_46012 [Suillus discolor]|uniref:Fungal-type protein kinase domain-containing protein n=1 Tax=Suillus discolor TaxID=1912936 RepID=A0A9P7JWX8_9AGAM|nr:uncharacterized protein F5147DRAFT_46012 [Suillus discolor]KAG2113440.1 hypothetical protein F5147DRAFT_46012 [Suillus discolor]
MANNVDATAPVTSIPPGNSGLSADLKSTPHAVTVVSGHIDILSVKKAVGIDHTDNRVIRIIVLRKLDPITTLSDKEFLLAWWEVVKCHRALWKRGVHHRNVNPSNIMGYSFGGRFISVLNDFDLSSIKQDHPRGFERTGTVPFMSLDLLTPEATADEVEHVYRHDVESLIWVLIWVSLRYEDGKLLSKDRPLDEWLMSNAVGCAKKKVCFMFKGIGSKNLRTPISHSVSWEVAKKCLAMVYKHGGPLRPASTNDEEVFQTWLQYHVPKDVIQANLLSGQ